MNSVSLPFRTGRPDLWVRCCVADFQPINEHVRYGQTGYACKQDGEPDLWWFVPDNAEYMGSNATDVPGNQFVQGNQLHLAEPCVQ